MAPAESEKSIRHLGSLLVAEIREYARNNPHARDEYGGFVDKNGDATPDANAAGELAAYLAFEILRAANRNGLGGCLLCRS